MVFSIEFEEIILILNESLFCIMIQFSKVMNSLFIIVPLIVITAVAFAGANQDSLELLQQIIQSGGDFSSIDPSAMASAWYYLKEFLIVF